MPHSICEKCGSAKVMVQDRCDLCGFLPETDEDLAKGIYLSELRFADDFEEQQRYQPELEKFAARIERGEKIEFEQSELDRLDQLRRDVESVTPGQVGMAFLRIFLPGILFLLGLYGLLFILREFDPTITQVAYGLFACGFLLWIFFFVDHFLGDWLFPTLSERLDRSGSRFLIIIVAISAWIVGVILRLLSH